MKMKCQSLSLLIALSVISSLKAGEFVKLWDKLPTKSTEAKDNPGFEIFLAPKAKANGIGILVCPGRRLPENLL